MSSLLNAEQIRSLLSTDITLVADHIALSTQASSPILRLGSIEIKARLRWDGPFTVASDGNGIVADWSEVLDFSDLTIWIQRGFINVAKSVFSRQQLDRILAGLEAFEYPKAPADDAREYEKQRAYDQWSEENTSFHNLLSVLSTVGATDQDFVRVWRKVRRIKLSTYSDNSRWPYYSRLSEAHCIPQGSVRSFTTALLTSCPPYSLHLENNELNPLVRAEIIRRRFKSVKRATVKDMPLWGKLTIGSIQLEKRKRVCYNGERLARYTFALKHQAGEIPDQFPSDALVIPDTATGRIPPLALELYLLPNGQKIGALYFLVDQDTNDEEIDFMYVVPAKDIDRLFDDEFVRSRAAEQLEELKIDLECARRAVKMHKKRIGYVKNYLAR